MSRDTRVGRELVAVGGQSSLKQSNAEGGGLAIGYTWLLPLCGRLWWGGGIAEVVLSPFPILALGLSVLNSVQ